MKKSAKHHIRGTDTITKFDGAQWNGNLKTLLYEQ
jgi:hypothetical protein